MIEKKESKLYPLFAILSGIIIIVFGLAMAKDMHIFFFLAGLWLLLLALGCFQAALKIIPIAALFSLIFFATSYLLYRNVPSALALVSRILVLAVAMIPGFSIRPVDLMRNLNQLRCPRSITLAMLIALNFAPLLRKEITQVREAMKTRGAGSFWNFKIFYRAFLIPLITRLVNISDTLALSVETRGFTMNNSPCSVYKKIKPTWKDFLYLSILSFGIVLTVLL